MATGIALPKLGILYGGTFDPVHKGHIAIATQVRDTFDAQVRLMPAADPPHRGPPGANADQRVAMLHLAIAGVSRLVLDLRELARDGPSFTVDTLQQLRAEVGHDAPWAIVVGADSLRTLDQWRRWRELFELVHLIVAERAVAGRAVAEHAVAEHAVAKHAVAEQAVIEHVTAAAAINAQAGDSVRVGLPEAIEQAVSGRWISDPQALRERAAGWVFALRQPLLPHSATALRHRIAAGEPWRDWVAPAVADYIDQQHLYR